jgi:four helix bundle protein
MKVTHFRDLRVYQAAILLQQSIFELSKRFPREERFSLTDQVRRSSRSIGANLAEAWRKRTYPAHFASKLSDSDAEACETWHWIHTARLRDYLSEEEARALSEEIDAIGGMIGKMIQETDHWCA